MKHIIKAATPRLSDEDLDPIEQDESDNLASSLISEGWLPWDQQDIADIKRLINDNMPEKQRKVFNAFLQGLSYTDIGVTEKYWRYHFSSGIEFIKQELGL